MVSELVPGQHTWSCQRDAEGHREYRIKHLVRITCDEQEPSGTGTAGPPNLGPATALLTPGLPQPGDVWNFDGDSDPWAFCRQQASVTSYRDGQRNLFAWVEQTFSTRPDPRRCLDQQQGDPLDEPVQVSVSFQKYQEEGTEDRFGQPIVSSSHEQIRGPENTWDATRFQVKIRMNVAELNLPLFDAAKNSVNHAPLWGLPRRCVKFSEFGATKNYYGSCSVYYTLDMTFDADGRTWDRDLLDEGTKVLHGHWHPTTHHWVLDNIDGVPPDPHNPAHFQLFQDRQGNPCRVILNGGGLPASVCVDGLGTTSGTGGVLVEQNRGRFNEGKFFVSLDYGQGWSLLDPLMWAELAGGYDPPAVWNSTTPYVRGNVVFFNSLYWFICVSPNTNFEPTFADTNWAWLPHGITDKGFWYAGDTYSPGDLVYGSLPLNPGTGPGTGTGTGGGNCVETLPGKRHVEYYREFDLTKLGIPLSL